MSPTLHPDRVDDHGASWVAAGLITEEQLDSIRRFEHLDDTDDRRLSVAAEVAVYLGSVLALSGGAMVVARRWEELAFAARLGVALVIAAAGIAGGVWSYRQGEPGTDRVGGFLSALGLAGVAFASGLVVIRADAGADELAVLVPGVAVIAVGAVLWRNRTRPLEFLAVVVASVAVVTAVVSLADLDVWVGGMTILLLGSLLAAVSATGRVHPRLVAIAAGAASAFGGAFALTEADERLGPIVALLVALALVVGATRADEPALVMLGVAGTLVATQAVLATSFDGAVAAAIVALLGVLLVVGVIVRSTRRDRAADG